MITLASSSPTRANLLKEAGINFTQFFFQFDEGKIEKNVKPEIYVQNVVKAKKEQFLKENIGLKNLLFADSCVACGDKILGKAKDEKEAIAMLNLQSGNECSVYTAMIFLGEFELINVSKTTYKFKKFNEHDLNEYIKNNEWQGKAGAMTIENFNKKYIISQHDETSTAMGLNLKILKAFL
ncbi:septum formation inhibitor Maf [Campylobacter concisus]|uniref:septum formation inhibitor Maf n=1 Tax=Campylobacter concisus TaxID=199 RepID=UPI000D3CD036|nr:septum formation inhibitor Maf [Campylobacter concisus]